MMAMRRLELSQLLAFLDLMTCKSSNISALPSKIMCARMSFHLPFDPNIELPFPPTALPGTLFGANRKPFSTAFLRKAVVHNKKIRLHQLALGPNLQEDTVQKLLMNDSLESLDI